MDSITVQVAVTIRDQLHTIVSGCIALRGLEAERNPVTDNVRTSLGLAVASIERALERLPKEGSSNESERTSRRLDEASIALSQAPGVTDLLITKLENCADEDKIEITGAASGTLVQCLFTIRSEIERGSTLMDEGRRHV